MINNFTGCWPVAPTPFKENEDLPTSSTLGQKRSDFIGKLEFSPNNLFGLNYSFSFDNDLKNSNYNFVETEFNVGIGPFGPLPLEES